MCHEVAAMDDLDLTPWPGVRLPADLEREVISRFRATWRAYPEARPSTAFTWLVMPEGTQTDLLVFATPELLGVTEVYFYDERRHMVRTATPEQVRHYFAVRNPWEENNDLYVFDPWYRWCIAVTHEMEVILVGSLV